MGSQDIHRVPAAAVEPPSVVEKWVHKVVMLMDELDELNTPELHRREYVMILAAAQALQTKAQEADRKKARLTLIETPAE